MQCNKEGCNASYWHAIPMHAQSRNNAELANKSYRRSRSHVIKWIIYLKWYALEHSRGCRAACTCQNKPRVSTSSAFKNSHSGSQGLHSRLSGLMIEIPIVEYIHGIKAREWVSKGHFGNNANMSFSYRAAKSRFRSRRFLLHPSEWHWFAYRSPQQQLAARFEHLQGSEKVKLRKNPLFSFHPFE